MSSIEGKLLHIVGEHMAIRFEVPEITSGQESTESDLHAIFAVDKSGSMSGRPIKDASASAISLTNKLRKVDVPVTVYCFNQNFKRYSSEELGYDELVHNLEDLKGGGGTNFSHTFKDYEKLIQEKKLKNIFFVWLSDGQDGSRDWMMNQIETHKQFLEANNVTVVTHCIGFSESHDAELLTKLTTCGTSTGTFQYVEAGGRIPVAVNNVYALAFQSSLWARLVTESSASYRVQIERENSQNLGLVFISENELEDCKVEVHNGELVQEFPVELVRVESKDIKELVKLVSGFVAFVISQSLESLDTAGAKLTELKDLIEESQRRIGELETRAQNLRVYKKISLEPFFRLANEVIQTYYEVLQSSGEGISTVDIATLNGVCNKLTLRKSLESKVIKEVGTEAFQSVFCEDQIDQVLENLDKEAVLQTEATEKCAISGKLWKEALLDGDCLCLPFYVLRPQNLVGDPYKVKVETVTSELVSHDSFFSSGLFESKAGTLMPGKRTYKHGEEPPKASSVVQGLPETPINAVLPLYLSPQHWEVASLRVKPLLGYDIDVDLFGFNETQLVVFPFKVLVTALKSCNANLMKDTCQAIYNENKDKVLESIKQSIQKLHENSEIEDIPLVVAHLYFAGSEFPETQSVLKHLFEKEFTKKFKFSQNRQKLVELLGINIDEHLKVLRDQVASQRVSCSEKFRNLAQNIQNNQEIKPALIEIEIPEYSFEGRVESVSDSVLQILSDINTYMQNSGKLEDIANTLRLNGIEPKSLQELGLVSNEQKIAFLVKAYVTQQFKVQDEFTEKAKRVDPFDEESSLEFVRYAITHTVNSEMKAFKSNLLKATTEAERLAQQFAVTEDLEDAAGCVLGIGVGDPGFPYFKNTLLQPNIPHIVQKVQMLTSGKFQGVSLIKDKNPGHWVPGAKIVSKIWQIHLQKGTKEEWQAAFPHKQQYFEHQYARMNGEFVPYTKPKKNVKDPRHIESRSQEPSIRRVRRAGRRGRGARGGRGGRGRRP
mmetsp:Transcript_7084/g.10451  ORF Transcript_7084/g.10451 Transcript_7084/m.10451 type:complete len:1002 (-) Transcript_7084:1135-4140(-)